MTISMNYASIFPLQFQLHSLRDQNGKITFFLNFDFQPQKKNRNENPKCHSVICANSNIKTMKMFTGTLIQYANEMLK